MSSDSPITRRSDWGSQKEPGATRLELIILLAMSLGASAGGYRYQIHQLARPGGLEQSKQSAIEWERRTGHGFFWGLVRQDTKVATCTLDDIEDIKLDSNLSFAVLAGATLGIWSPVEVSWRCARLAARLRPSDYPTRFKPVE